MSLMRNITVIPYSPDWPALYSEAARLLTDTLKDLLIELHHIGSTAVPGLAAKPVIDILAIVTSLDALDDCHEGMCELGYEPKGELGIAGRRFFSKGSDESRTHHIHAFEKEHPAVARHLGFRDYLRLHPEEARRYAEVKVQLARQHPNDIETYIDGKTPLIQEFLAKAGY